MSRFRVVVASVAIAAVLAAGSFAAGTRLSAGDAPSGFERVVEAAERLRRDSARPVSDEELVRAAIEGMLGALNDPYAALLDPDQAREVDDLLTGSFVGIGVWLESSAQGLRVTSIVEGSPAEAAGLKAGDIIAEADGHPMGGVGVDEAARVLRGPEGTTVTLVVVSGKEEREVEVTRARVSLADVDARMVRGRVAYAHPLQFGRGMAGRLRAELAQLLEAGAGAIVLDLRGNRGGLADEAIRVASLFLDHGPVALIREPDEAERRIETSGTPLATDVPMALLVDGATASASELVVGALADHDRASVVGSPTFGKGSVLTVGHLAGSEESIQFTTAYFLTPDGHRIEGRGIRPDVEVLPGGSEDAALERAVRIVLRGD
ncbi:MAG: S41 family peptidase [Actinomycetota bacterium]